jgi:DnaJ-domain-containing protein 1
MPVLLIGLAGLLLLLWGLRVFANMDARLLLKNVRVVGGFAALGGAALLTATGRFPVALPLGIFGLGLLEWIPMKGMFAGHAKPSPGQSSKARASMIEMELDHDSGEMRGTVLTGQYAGMPLDALSVDKLLSLLSSLDEESRALLEVYLDRREPTWRENVQEDAGTRAAQPSGKGPMSEEEARQILGVKPGASAIEIRRAHRSLMLKLHPDQGGSTYLAARVNEAKEILLRTHH